MNLTPRHALCCLILSLTALAFTMQAHAQGPPPLPTGSLTNPTPYGACPTGFMGPPMTCWQTTVSCTGVGDDPMQLIFGFAPAASAKGLIVLFNGEGGTSADTPDSQDMAFATYYQSNGYNVVQTKWMSDWEYATNPNDPQPTYNIQYAACRPATFLWWLRNTGTLLNGNAIFPTTIGAGMCAQGFSAGAAEIAYDLAWYNGGAPTSQGGAALDKVILNVGPPLTNIETGCTDDPGNIGEWTAICTAGQPYCSGWTYNGMNGISQSDAYVNGTEGWIRNWTNQPSCQTGTYNSNIEDIWEDQSIINTDTSDPQPNLSYPSTGISSYLCQTFSKGAANENNAQGFELLSLVAPAYLTVNAVQGCVYSEGFTGTGATVLYLSSQQRTMTVVETDMVQGANGTTKCTRSKGH